jgi:protocatechuate 3,4-dioxygenase beta subunit
MKMMTLLMLVALMQAAPPAAQKPPEPGIIRGQVTDSATGLPLEQVRVELTAVPRTIEGTRRTQTDAEGRYRFSELPPARYTIQFQKGRYVTLQYGKAGASRR